MNLNIPDSDKKRLVIVGGGFAGLALIRGVRRSNLQVVLVDKHNYHMFKPLLYQVASSALNVGDIAFPFRKMFHGWRDFYFRMAYIDHVDRERNVLVTTIGEVHYDYLVLATGCVPNFFGLDNIKQASLAMSNITDALNIRNRILRNFELAVTARSDSERMLRLNVVIVGGGASGVEIAGALSEMRCYVMPRDYPRLDISHMNIYLIEGQNRLLSSMSDKTSGEALRELEEKGVKVLLNTKVTDFVDNHAVFENGDSIPTRNLIWTSGIRCSVVQGLDESVCERGRRIGVDVYNRVRECESIYAIGDVSLMHDDARYPEGHPQLARVAISQGQRLAKNLLRDIQDEPMQPYQYKNYGVLATVGRNRAFVEWKKIQFGGFVAWLIWSVVHIMFLLGIQGKVRVFWGWVWNYFGHDLPIRLIIGSYERQKKEDQTPE